MSRDPRKDRARKRRDDESHIDWDRVRASFSRDGRRASFDAWKASHIRPVVPPPPVGMRSPVYAAAVAHACSDRPGTHSTR